MRASITQKGTWTTAQIQALINGAGASQRLEIRGSTIRSAGVNDFQPPAVGGVNPAVVPGTALLSMMILPMHIVENPPGVYTCTSNAVDLLDPDHPAVIAQRIANPPNFPVHHAGQANESCSFKVVGYSGSEIAQSLAKRFVSIGQKFDLPANVGIIVLDHAEGQIITDQAAIAEGKKQAILAAAPLAHVHALSQITPAKSLLYKLYTDRLFYMYGSQQHITIFQQIGKPLDNALDRVKIENFTDANLMPLINDELRVKIDPSLTLDGLQVTRNEALAFSQLAFGSGLKDFPSSKFIIKDNMKHGNPPASIAQRVQNLDGFFQVLALLFDDWFVKRLQLLVPQIQTTLRPASGEEFSTLFDCFLKAIGQVSELQATSLPIFQAFVEDKLNLTETNPHVSSWRRDKQALAAAEHDVRLEKLEEALRSKKDIPPPTERLVPAPKRKNDAPQVDDQAERLEAALTKYKTIRPLDLPSGCTDLCPRIARGDACMKFKAGKCEFAHIKDPKWMSKKYIKWCTEMPTYNGMKKTKIQKA